MAACPVLNRGLRILALTGLAAISPSFGKFSASGCPDVYENQFRYVKLFGNASDADPFLLEPVHMALDKQANDSVDIYFVERRGKLKYYNGATHAMSLLATLDVDIQGVHDDGLTGIALDPDFRKNRWLYLYYTPKAPEVFRVSRFTLAGDKLDLASEKILLSIPMQRKSCCHTGGAMVFDAKGDLWITTGNNSPDAPSLVNESDWTLSAEASSGNPSDLRGGVLRIHPDNSAKGYSIPAGNFGDYWAKKFADQGNTSLAAQYADHAQVLPEIYVKGTRSNYSIAVDPYRERLAWGEFLPPGVDEHNLVNHPTFAGYPYWGGPGDRAFAKGGSLAAPMNNSRWNKGPRQLPPAEPALHPYFTPGGGGGVTGPIYRYDGALKSKIKFPPHFDKAWFVTDFFWSGVKILGVNEAGERLNDSLDWFGVFNLENALDMEQGPDGALYVLNYAGRYTSTANTSFGRIEYTGSCLPAEPSLPTRIGIPGPGNPGGAEDGFVIRPGILYVTLPGSYRLILKDVGGREVFSAMDKGPREFALDAILAGRQGVFLMTLESGSQIRHAQVYRF